MNHLEMQEYFDNNIDDVTLLYSENELVDGLKTLQDSGIETIIGFHYDDNGCSYSVEVDECPEEVVIRLMRLNWYYEGGFWIYETE